MNACGQKHGSLHEYYFTVGTIIPLLRSRCGNAIGSSHQSAWVMDGWQNWERNEVCSGDPARQGHGGLGDGTDTWTIMGRYWATIVLHWCYMNVKSHQLLDRLFSITIKKTSKLIITGHLWGESTGHQWISLTKGQVLSGEWRCWSSADRWCSNYIWVINNLIGD